MWFDRDILRINFDNHGEYLGEFHGDEQILVIRNNGEFYLTPIDLNNHYEEDTMIIEKYDPTKVWTAILYDASQQNLPYVKRFTLDANIKKQNCLGENRESKLIWFSDTPYPRIQVMFGGGDQFREPLVLELDEFIGTKSFKARGKRLTQYVIDEIIELEPTRHPEPPALPELSEGDEESDENGGDSAVQLNLFEE